MALGSYIMGLEGQRPAALEQIRGELYGVMPRSLVRAGARLNGLGSIFDPNYKKWYAIGGFLFGMWLSSSPRGKALVRRVRGR